MRRPIETQLPLLLILFLIPTASAQEVTLGGERLKVDLLHEEDFEGVANRWRFDGRGRVWLEDGRLHTDATGSESTAWFTGEMEGNLLITFQAHILEPVEANNINLIFLATAPGGGDVLKLYFNGSYSEYHKIPNYIWTFTGTHTRLRRDPGFQLLSEDKAIVPEAHKTYDLALTIRDGLVRCFVDHKPVHSYKDPQPHGKGKLAFRTFHTRLWWDNLRVYRVLKGRSPGRGRLLPDVPQTPEPFDRPRAQGSLAPGAGQLAHLLLRFDPLLHLALQPLNHVRVLRRHVPRFRAVCPAVVEFDLRQTGALGLITPD